MKRFTLMNRALSWWLVAGFPPKKLGFEPSVGRVRIVVGKMISGPVFSEYITLTIISPCALHSLITLR